MSHSALDGWSEICGTTAFLDLPRGAGLILGETPRRLGRSLKPIKGDLLLFFQMRSSNVDTYTTLTGFSDKFQYLRDENCELLQADWLLNGFLPAQAGNYCHRWRRSSITRCCTLITLDILLLSVKNYLHVCKFSTLCKCCCTGIRDWRPNSRSIAAICCTNICCDSVETGQ